MSYELELMVGKVRGNPFGPRRELVSTKDGRLMLVRTEARDGVAKTEWELPYKAVRQYWSFKFSATEGGRASRQVMLVSDRRRFTVSLDAEDGEDLLRLLKQHAPHAERVRGLHRYRRPWSAAVLLGLPSTAVFVAVVASQLLGLHL